MYSFKQILFTTILLGFFVGVNAQDWDSLRADLEKDYYQGLRLRSKVRLFISSYGAMSKEMDSLNQAISNFDSLTVVKASAIIENYGWPGKSMVGEIANKSVFYAIQHADLEIMKKYYEALKESVKTGESDPWGFALLTDRILIDSNKPQMYGTQYYFDEEVGQYFFYPIENIREANRMPRKVGMQPLKKYAKRNNIVISDTSLQSASN